MPKIEESKITIDPYTLEGVQKKSNLSTEVQKHVEKDIEKLVQMSPGLEAERFVTENLLLKEMMETDQDQDKIDNIIDVWISKRLNDLKMQSSKEESNTFKMYYDSSLQSELMNKFREEIGEELGLASETTDKQLSFESKQEYLGYIKDDFIQIGNKNVDQVVGFDDMVTN